MEVYLQPDCDLTKNNIGTLKKLDTLNFLPVDDDDDFVESSNKKKENILFADQQSINS